MSQEEPTSTMPLTEENLSKNVEMSEPSTQSIYKQYHHANSNDSIESSYQENEELKKKILQGFDEKKDHEDMVCKRLCKENKHQNFNDYEKIQDLNTYASMFPVHKASKFGGRVNRQMSSKMQQIHNDYFDKEGYTDEDIELNDGSFGLISFRQHLIRKIIVNFSTLQVTGKIRERPDVEVTPALVSLKKLAKLVFLSKEQIEKVIIRHLSFNGEKKSLFLDRSKVIENLRDVDINHTKRKFSQIKSKLVIPQAMFEEDFTESDDRQMEEDDFEEFKQQIGKSHSGIHSLNQKSNSYTIDIIIEFPRAVLTFEENGVQKTFTKSLNAEELTLLIKDKFANWKELLLDIFQKKLDDKQFSLVPGQENFFTVHKDDIEERQNCYEIERRQNEMTHTINFKFNLRWDFDDPALFTYFCNFNDPQCSLQVMSSLKIMKVDILKLFAQESSLFYYDPSSIWSMQYDFKKGLDKLEGVKDSDDLLASTDRVAQRDLIRIKNKSKWLILEMQQPTLTVIKNFESALSADMFGDKYVEVSPKKFLDEQKIEWRLKTQILDDFAQSQMQNWEIKALKYLKINIGQLNIATTQQQ
ncbi:UNKNOWN [Stylonychia lemnae]|uniref:Uncharacterized protein n=1 Tax=Stylonychia lemnae TaxID=5949 RepID=A0A078A484_STYLE|nr:UNKNOWN [Stylonychia lemnae]|eukprot:CDW77078.1 UNKNOWN [Stylonychia lemnae]